MDMGPRCTALRQTDAKECAWANYQKQLQTRLPLL
jgi:hypothetical protein